MPPGTVAETFDVAVKVSQTWKPEVVATMKWRFWLINFIELILVVEFAPAVGVLACIFLFVELVLLIDC